MHFTEPDENRVLLIDDTFSLSESRTFVVKKELDLEECAGCDLNNECLSCIESPDCTGLIFVRIN